MSIDLSALTPDLATRFIKGDEDALTALFRGNYDKLLGAAQEALGDDLSHFGGRVVQKVVLDAWASRSQFQDPKSIAAFFAAAIPAEVAVQKRKHLSLHRNAAPAKVTETLSADDAVQQLLSVLHAPKVDHESALNEAKHARARFKKASTESGSGKRWIGGLVVLAAVVLVVIYFQRYMDKAGQDALVDRSLRSEDTQTLASGNGQRGTVTLHDGTAAAMGSATRLRVPPDFGIDIRTIVLSTGTANFQVAAQDPEKPMDFAVRAGNTTVTSHGTVFTMRYYPETDSTVYVGVSEGSVTIRDRVAKTEQELSAGDAYAVSTTGEYRSLTPMERDVEMAWVRDTIVFDGTPLGRVLPELMIWFSFNSAPLDPALADRPVSMRVPLSSSGEAIDALVKAANLKMTFTKGQLMQFEDAGAARK